MDENIWDSVDNVELPTGTYFGKVNLEAWYCVLRKGEGAIPFDPNQHKLEERRTQIHVMITPLSSSRTQFLTERKVLAESREWVKITLASIKALGKSTRELENKWVQYVMEPTGRTYIDKNGVEKENTMPKFLAVYDSEEAAEQAKNELYVKVVDRQTTTAGVNGDDNAERKVAELFLKSLIQTVDQDRQKIAALLASQPLISKYFTLESPEVQALLNRERGNSNGIERNISNHQEL